MGASEFRDWQAFFEVEPFGQLRDDLRAGTIAATIANIHRDKKRRNKPYSIRDFMPGYELALSEQQTQSAATLLQKIAIVNAALGGKDERNRQSDR